MADLSNTSLPLLLAGPILRRTDPTCVNVWLATSRAVSVKGLVCGSAAEPLGLSGQHLQRLETVQVGGNLFITLLAITPLSGTFPIDELLMYDVTLDGQNLKQLGLTQEQTGVVYPGMDLPSFFIPSVLRTLLHGSCRKPHGKKPETRSESQSGMPQSGESDDAFARADALFLRHSRSLADRPAALFLTGDQIYADDVAGPLSRYLLAQGDRLMGGWVEDIPGLDPVRSIPLYARRDALRGKQTLWSKVRPLFGLKPKNAPSELTSDYSLNHLLTFGEYAAMYLSVWNPDFWPQLLPEADASIPEQYQEKYAEEREALEVFQRGLHQVRRVMANVPTYMIFDDHEITDDWNLTKTWHDKVYGNSSGRRIIANGLAAYWAFQGWGNAPDHFLKAFVDEVSAHLCDQGQSDQLAQRFDTCLLEDFHHWGYALPTTPPVVVVNARTQRHFDSTTGPAQLMNDVELTRMKAEFDRLGEGQGDQVLLVSPAPVYGFEPIETLQKIGTSFGLPAWQLDHESWIANREGFGALMRCLVQELGIKKCVVLSGDVHYGFSTQAQFHGYDGTIEVRQLTSSAMNNSPKGGGLLRILGASGGRTEHRMGLYPFASRMMRLSRPLWELLVRWELMDFDSTTPGFWTDHVQGIVPRDDNQLLIQKGNIGVIHLGKPGLESNIVHELYTTGRTRRFIL